MNQATANSPLILVEDNARDREFLTTVLEDRELHVAEDAEQGFALMQSVPDADLVSDIQLPGMSGIDLAKQVWSLRPTARIVFWSQFDDEVYVRALDRVTPAGTVFGYVLKSSHSDALLHVVFEDNQNWVDPQVRVIQARAHTGHALISDIEYEALVDITLGLTDQLIAPRLCLTRRGVQSRLKSLYEKLGVDRALNEQGINPRSRAVALALQRGLINRHELEMAEQEFAAWLATQGGKDIGRD